MPASAPISTSLLDSLITSATLAERLGTTERSLSESPPSLARRWKTTALVGNGTRPTPELKLL